MIQKHTLNHSYSLWIDQRIKEFSKRDISLYGTQSLYMLFNALFITFTFDNLRILARKRHDAYQRSRASSPEFYNLNHFYNEMSRCLLGRDFMKPKFLQERPLMIACSDAEGSRYWKELNEVKNLHIHSIWVFRPGQKERFEEKYETFKTSMAFHKLDFDQVDIRAVDEYDATDQTPSRLASYTTKFLGFNTPEIAAPEDIMIYPRQIH